MRRLRNFPSERNVLLSAAVRLFVAQRTHKALLAPASRLAGWPGANGWLSWAALVGPTDPFSDPIRGSAAGAGVATAAAAAAAAVVSGASLQRSLCAR